METVMAGIDLVITHGSARKDRVEDVDNRLDRHVPIPGRPTEGAKSWQAGTIE
jgi:hypothetical protein